MDTRLPSLVFDFDSTLVTVEAADELFARSMEGAADRREKVARFRSLTERGMTGEIPYLRSLEARLSMLDVSSQDVASLAQDLLGHITPSVRRNRNRLRAHRDRIWVISGGFEELIVGVTDWMGLPRDRVCAHRLRWDAEDRLVGVDPETALARGGKPRALRELAVPEPIWVVGDGMTDLELKELGLAQRFLAFVENCRRPGVAERADAILTTLDALFHDDPMSGPPAPS